MGSIKDAANSSYKMHISAHKFFSFNAIVCYELQRTITHKTTPLRVVRIFFQIVAHISRRVLFWQCTARWAEAKVITKFFPIWQPLKCLPPWLWLIKNDFLFAGYGNIVPITVQGRLFCVLYALIGMPGTCLTRKSIGDKITELFPKLITNRLLRETRFEKITSDWKSGAKSYVDNDCGKCGLPTIINGSLAWFTWDTRNGHISSVFNLLSRLWVQLVWVITFGNLRTALITHLFFEHLLEQ